MTLIRRNFADLPSLASNLLDDFFSGDLMDMSNLRRQSTLPEVNISELNEKFRIELAAPGMKKDDFKIDLDHNVLTISSEQKEENNEEQKDDKAKVQYTKREFHYSSFKRSFTLPEVADTEKISAKYEDGLLVVEITKKDEAVLNTKKSISIE